jgi:hypothetical protein
LNIQATKAWAASLPAPPRSLWWGSTKAWESAWVAGMPKRLGIRVMENGSPVLVKVVTSHSPFR